MAERRMFSLAIANEDKFVEMPATAQALYFHLGLRADDEGFVGSCKQLIRGLGFQTGDLKTLIQENYVILFESGVIVITDWNTHNSVRKDRFKPTRYQEEKAQLENKDGNFSLINSDLQTVDNQITTVCQPSDNQMSAQDRLGKVRLGKDNKDLLSFDNDVKPPFDYKSVFSSFNSICKSLPTVTKFSDKRKKAIKNAVKILENTTFEELFKKVESSDFLTGRNEKGWRSNFDWILNPTNLVKILEGNYENKTQVQATIRNYEEEAW